ncbi:MAG: hypothetical protein WD738_09820 [Pirellulales bacterium]
MRCFVLGAGFSQPAGMPNAGDLTSLLIQEVLSEDGDEVFHEWLDQLQQAIRLINGIDSNSRVSVEELFYYAPSTAEMRRMQQQMCPVGRMDFETPHKRSEEIDAWLARLNEELVRVIVNCERGCELQSAKAFCSVMNDDDVVVSFNYDTIVERSLESLGRGWNHGLRNEANKQGVTVLKLHGSVDWFMFRRGTANYKKYELLFRKDNVNGVENDEDAAFELCRIQNCELLNETLNSVHLDLQPANAQWGPALGGLGLYKPLHRVPGLGNAWERAGRAISRAESIIVVGFSLSPFDTMARLQLAAAKLYRKGDVTQRMIVADPSDEVVERYRQIFGREVETPLQCASVCGYQDLDWSQILATANANAC